MTLPPPVPGAQGVICYMDAHCCIPILSIAGCFPVLSRNDSASLVPGARGVRRLQNIINMITTDCKDKDKNMSFKFLESHYNYIVQLLYEGISLSSS